MLAWGPGQGLDKRACGRRQACKAAECRGAEARRAKRGRTRGAFSSTPTSRRSRIYRAFSKLRGRTLVLARARPEYCENVTFTLVRVQEPLATLDH